MQNKLQELTDKLYQEGLAKGKAEGEKLLEDAQTKAEGIISDASAQAQSIIDEAEAKATDLKAKAESDIRSSSQQALQSTKKDIENLLLYSTVGEKIKKELANTDLLKEVIMAVAKNFSAQESTDIALVLPQNVKSEIEPWVSNELKNALDKEIKAEFSKKLSGGFTIGPADGSYFISLTDDTFMELICEYLRPVTKKILFGE